MTRSTPPRRPVAAALGLPYPPYLWRVAGRSAIVWVLARLASAWMLLLAAGPTVALHPTASTRVVLVAVTAFLVWWDRRRSRELLLPADLGASPVWFWAVSLLTAATLDVAAQALLAGH